MDYFPRIRQGLASSQSFQIEVLQGLAKAQSFQAEVLQVLASTQVISARCPPGTGEYSGDS